MEDNSHNHPLIEVFLELYLPLEVILRQLWIKTTLMEIVNAKELIIKGTMDCRFVHAVV